MIQKCICLNWNIVILWKCKLGRENRRKHLSFKKPNFSIAQSCHEWESYCYGQRKHFYYGYIALYIITGSFETSRMSFGVIGEIFCWLLQANCSFNNCKSIKVLRNVKIIKTHISKNIISWQSVINLPSC